MIIEWEELVTSIALIWHQTREYVLEQEMIRVWEVIVIQYRKAHPKASLDIVSDNEAVQDMDHERTKSIRAQKKMRERIRKEREEIGNKE